jgi:hypothetical protein
MDSTRKRPPGAPSEAGTYFSEPVLDRMVPRLALGVGTSTAKRQSLESTGWSPPAQEFLESHAAFMYEAMPDGREAGAAITAICARDIARHPTPWNQR